MDTSGRRTARVNVAPDGGFRAVLPDLPRGKVVIFGLTATLHGARPWKTQIVAARSGVRGVFTAPDLVVPEQDSTPPTAELILRAGARFVTSISPVRPRQGAAGPSAVACNRPHGCRPRQRRRRLRPDPSIAHVYPRVSRPRHRQTHHSARNPSLPAIRDRPGQASARWSCPGRAHTASAVRLPTQTGSVIRGKTWADATNASGLESFSDQVPFVFRTARSP